MTTDRTRPFRGSDSTEPRTATALNGPASNALNASSLESTPERYCKPWNTGLQSTSPAVARRLGRLFDALSEEITSTVVSGEIVEDIRRFRFALLERLEAEGWFGTYDGGNRFKVYPPGSPTGARKRADMERRLNGGGE